MGSLNLNNNQIPFHSHGRVCEARVEFALVGYDTHVPSVYFPSLYFRSPPVTYYKSCKQNSYKVCNELDGDLDIPELARLFDSNLLGRQTPTPQVVDGRGPDAECSHHTTLSRLNCQKLYKAEIYLPLISYTGVLDTFTFFSFT